MEIYREEKVEIAIYKGEKYRRLPESKNKVSRVYFKKTFTGKKTVRLHVEIYKDVFGEIPEGCNIHHKDGDPLNNKVSNLICISKEEHARIHAKEYQANNKEFVKANLDRIRPLTKKWQQSEEGWQHYSKMGKKAAKNRKIRKYVCDSCGEGYFSNSITKTRFCSTKCKNKWRRDSEVDLVERTCPICEKSFMVNKYTKTKTCSRKCGGRLQVKNRENKQ